MITGQEAREARTAAGLSLDGLGRELGYHGASLCRWEAADWVHPAYAAWVLLQRGKALGDLDPADLTTTEALLGRSVVALAAQERYDLDALPASLVRWGLAMNPDHADDMIAEWRRDRRAWGELEEWRDAAGSLGVRRMCTELVWRSR